MHVPSDSYHTTPHEHRYRFVLKPSHIPAAGVGCFASSPLPVGAQVSPGFEEKFRRLPIEDIPDEYLKFCVLLPDGLFLSPENFLRMGVFWYINHARVPNLVFERHRLRTARPIDTGEELTLYYSDLLTHPKNVPWAQEIDIDRTRPHGAAHGAQ